MTDWEDLTEDEWDAEVMYDYLEWRVGSYYQPEHDLGSPTSAFEPAGVRYAHQNPVAFRLLIARLDELGLTEDQARGMLRAGERSGGD